jgi:hypothetical protein
MKSVAQASIFDRVVARLFGGGQRRPGDEADRQLIDETIEVVVDMVEPRVRHDARYRNKLEGGVRNTIAYLRAIAREPLEPVLLARAAWSDDPRLNAFVARADDVPRAHPGTARVLRRSLQRGGAGGLRAARHGEGRADRFRLAI